MDMIETEDKSLEGLAGLVLEKFSAHWQLTIDFLKIITEYWPAYLAERGLMSAAGRRNAVIHAEARRLAASPPKGPVIIAGVSGSIPATVELMRTVMGLPQGAIVLPALDLALDDASWDTIKPDDCRCHGASREPAIRHEDVARWAGAFARGCLGAQGRGAGARSSRAFRVRVRGHAARGHDGTVAGLRRGGAQRQGEAARGSEPRRSADCSGRSRSCSAHFARSRQHARQNGRARFAGSFAGTPRRRAPRSLGHQGRRQRRTSVREDAAGCVSRSRHQRGGQELRAARADGVTQTSADAPRARSVRGPARSACLGDRGVPHGLSRRRPRRRRSSARTGSTRDGSQEAPRPRGQSALAGRLGRRA